MKTLFSLFLCITSFWFSSITINAEETPTTISDGYTLEGIYYEVYEISTEYSANTSRDVYTVIEVTREFRYDGIVAPPSQKYYYATIHGYAYEGTLVLSRIYFEDGNTHAVYTGTLTIVR